MIVDTHVHVLATDLQRYPVAPVGGQASEWALEQKNTVEDFLLRMKEAVVDQATLVQASSYHGYDNSYTAECAARFPDKLVGICCIDPLLPDAVSTLDYWVQERNMRGMRLFTVGSSLAEGRWLDDPRSFPAWKRCGELGIPVDAQVRVSGFDMLKNILERFPEVRIVLDHLGRPKLDDGPIYGGMKELLALSRYQNLYLKCTENNLRDAENGTSTTRGFLERLLESYGAGRIIWGGNFPAPAGDPPVQVPYVGRVEHAKSAFAFLAPADQESILSGNARELYPALKHTA